MKKIILSALFLTGTLLVLSSCKKANQFTEDSINPPQNEHIKTSLNNVRIEGGCMAFDNVG